MALSARTQATIASGRYDGVTQQERIAEKLDMLTAALEQAQDALDWYEDQHMRIPAYVQDAYQDAVTRLETYSNYWGFDC